MSSFVLPDGLGPELYPLAWMVGTWRGPGVLSYPTSPSAASSPTSRSRTTAGRT